eukprot:1012866-Pelagomonas_calceolata.AAC.3
MQAASCQQLMCKIPATMLRTGNKLTCTIHASKKLTSKARVLDQSQSGANSRCPTINGGSVASQILWIPSLPLTCKRGEEHEGALVACICAVLSQHAQHTLSAGAAGQVQAVREGVA